MINQADLLVGTGKSQFLFSLMTVVTIVCHAAHIHVLMLFKVRRIGAVIYLMGCVTRLYLQKSHMLIFEMSSVNLQKYHLLIF